MLEVIIATAVIALGLVTIDLLRNDEIFTENSELNTGNGRLSPYTRNEATFSDTEVEITELDETRINQAVEAIREILGPEPVKKLSEMNAEQRTAAAGEMHRALCEVFSMNIGLQLEASDNNRHMGYYDYNNNVLWENSNYLMSTNPECIEEYLDTIIHEFRHAMQYNFIFNEQYYNGASEEYRKKMTFSLHPDVYVTFEENPELYSKQLCERDADKFAKLFITKLKGGK